MSVSKTLSPPRSKSEMSSERIRWMAAHFLDPASVNRIVPSSKSKAVSPSFRASFAFGSLSSRPRIWVGLTRDFGHKRLGSTR